MSQVKKSLNNAWIRGCLMIGSATLAIYVGVALVNSPLGHAQLQSLKLIPQPEGYTELSFVQKPALPTDPAENPINFSFVVHNVTGKSLTYPYVVELHEASGYTAVLSHGILTLPSGSSVTKPESVVLSPGTRTSQISVILTNQNQKIAFWLRSTP